MNIQTHSHVEQEFQDIDKIQAGYGLGSIIVEEL